MDILSQGIKIENNNFIFSLTDNKKNRSYEHEQIIEMIAKNDGFETYKKIITNEKESIEFNTYLDSNDNDNKIFYSDKYAQHINGEGLNDIDALSFIYEKMHKQHKIEIFKDISGIYKATKVKMFIQDIGIVIVTDNISLEDLINLISIKDYSIYSLGYSFDEITLFQITANSYAMKAYSKFINSLNLKMKNADAKVRVSNIRQVEKHSLIDIEASEDVICCYNTMIDEEQWAFYEILKVEKILSKYNYIRSKYNLLKKYENTLPTIDDLLNSFYTYEDELIENDSRGMSLHFSTKYVQESTKIIKKNFENSFRNTINMFKKFFTVLRNNLKIETVVNQNYNSPHYIALNEAVQELKKIWYISEVFAFGSVVTGCEKKDSDINIAVKLGFNMKKLTTAKRSDINTKIKGVLQKIDTKYSKDIEHKGIHRGPINYEYPLFNVVNISDITNITLDFYTLSGAFDRKILFFVRNEFTCTNEMGDSLEISYKDINLVDFKLMDSDYIILNYELDNNYADKATIYNLKDGSIMYKAKIDTTNIKGLYDIPEDFLNFEYINKELFTNHYKSYYTFEIENVELRLLESKRKARENLLHEMHNGNFKKVR